MSLFDDIKNKAKESVANIDWNELNSKKDNAIRKASEIKNQYVGDVLDKSKTIKDEYDRNYKEKIGEKLYKKEIEMKNKESELRKTEKSLMEMKHKLQEKERRLHENFIIPKVYVYIPVTLLIVSFLAVEFYDFASSIEPVDRQVKRNIYNEITNTSEDQVVYDVYDGVDTSNPKFDVGNYCLDQEKSGSMDFDKCLGLSATKIIGRSQW